MASFIPYDLRRLIINRRQSGVTYGNIQKEIGYSISGIRKIWYQYQKEGASCLRPKYENCGRKSDYSQSVRDAIKTIRTGDQGASFVYSMLSVRYPDLPRPHIRTIQRWWEQQQTNRPKGRPSESEKKKWSEKAHETWQIDGKELVCLKSGKKFSWMNVGDEGTSAHLKASVHPVPRVSQIDLRAATWAVNLSFARYGIPSRIKIDNGQPFVNPNYRDIPTKAKLWWIGLGIEVVQNRPRVPQENGIVECLQGICYRWINPSQLQTPEELQIQLDQISDFQRNHYELPNRAYKTRIALYPELEQNPRKYNPDNFNMKLVDQFLAKQVWQRKANQNGQVSFFDHRISIGRAFKNQKVFISFDDIERQWVFRDSKGYLLNTSSKAIPSEEEIKKFAVISKNFQGFLSDTTL